MDIGIIGINIIYLGLSTMIIGVLNDAKTTDKVTIFGLFVISTITWHKLNIELS